MANPYTNNKIAYSAVLESAAANARGWRAACLLSICISVLAVIGVVYIGSQSKFIPVVVEVDGYGRPAQMYTVSAKIDRGDDRIIKAALSTAITGVRSVSLDAEYSKRKLNDVINYFESGSPAFNRIQRYLSDPKTNPFTRAKTELVEVRINNVFRLTTNSWQAEWTEYVNDRTGRLLRSVSYKSTLTVTSASEMTEEVLYVNPMGILIRDFEWSRQVNEPNPS